MIRKRDRTITRRMFLGTAGAAAATVAIVPRHAVAQSGQAAPSERLNIAGIGVGGVGKSDVWAVAGGAVSGGNNIVALADVDWKYAAETFKAHEKARQFKDFRKMFDEMEKQIDAVVVATPDHTHAVAAMAAIKRGKHVYCEKPLAHSVHEVRQLMKAAKEHNVVTQLGNQGHSSESIRMFCEWIWDGAIGKVETIHCGTACTGSGIDALGQLQQQHKVPESLDWDLWLGPAQQRPYCPAYHPRTWRGWVPFGNSAIGDWGCHVIDPVFWAFDLGAPKTILAEIKDYDFQKLPDVFPKSERITFEFPAKGDRGPITLHWYGGSERVPRPVELEEGRRYYDDYGGTGVVIGERGTITFGSQGAKSVRIIPEAKMKAYKLPAKKLPRTPGHHADWIEAVRKGTKAGSDFSYGGPLSELALLGVIAIKLNGTKLEWDAEKGQFTNCPEANQHLNPPYREGWTL